MGLCPNLNICCTEDLEGDISLASFPTLKDHVPADMEVKRGCLEVSEHQLNIFVCLREVTKRIGNFRISYRKIVVYNLSGIERLVESSRIVKNKFRQLL